MSMIIAAVAMARFGYLSIIGKRRSEPSVPVEIPDGTYLSYDGTGFLAWGDDDDLLTAL